jgi:hypothetical protein
MPFRHYDISINLGVPIARLPVPPVHSWGTNLTTLTAQSFVRTTLPQPQKAKRSANCMKRGVVSVETYLPNSDASKESEG